MSRHQVRESDLRSLERARMYRIFAPLDADEPLPRELLMAARRHRTIGRWELAGALWLPVLVLTMTLAAWGGLPAPMAVGLVASAFGGLLVFAASGGRRPRLK
jgi:hypothetical protein